ncbi:MAG: Gfo/Idh/MocA family oxidoreductase [Candidatus Brocadiaceae bacterium]|nr:Gfo/Idh/MocA family oxidoreductase [Candidatus Brocadiaceae bacterium]
MAEESVRYGMIGCGEIAVRSFEGLMAAANAELAATFDVKQELAQDLAGRVGGAAPCASQDELLARDDVEAVIISTPHFLHEPIAIAALRAGKHVLVEKPIACTVEQGQRMVDCAAETGGLLGVCFVRRYIPGTEAVRRFVAAGHIGSVMGWVLVEMSYKKETYWTGGYSQRAQTDWRLRRRTAGGGFLIMNTIHTLDHFRYVSGQEVVDVQALAGTYNSPEGVEVEDLFGAAVKLSGGGIGTIAGGSAVPGGVRGNAQRLIGTKGQINFEAADAEGVPVYVQEEVEFEGRTIPGGEWTKVDFAGGVHGNSRALLIEGFGRWVRGAEPFRAPGDDALKSLAACEEVYRAAGLVD